MSPRTKRLFLWFLSVFFCISILLILISLYHNFRTPRLQPTPARELRGVWMSRFDYTNITTTHDQDSIRSFIAKTFSLAKSANLNAIFFQIRGNCDVLYSSKIEPWSALLTGELGKNPGWDPLQYAIEQAHALGLELHAWINVFPAWRGTVLPPRTTPLHPILAHPDWLVCDSSGKAMPFSEHYVSFSPGIPAVQEHILKILAEIVTNYDIDGIHFDYVRYPEGANRAGFSHDKISLKRFKDRRENPQNLKWEDWQREQITTFVARAYDCITTIKPYVKVSAAVIGNYKSSAWNGYHIVFQDPRRWVEIGKIDWLIPMIYYGRQERANAFPIVIKEWKNYLEEQRPFFAGIGAYRLAWHEVLDEINDVRNNRLSGMVFFAISSLDTIKLNALRTQKFLYPALTPACPWKSSQLPPPPIKFTVTATEHDFIFTWDTISSTIVPQRYVIYQDKKENIALHKGENILAILNGADKSYRLSKALVKPGHYVTITSVDHAGNESLPAKAIKL